MSFVGAWRVCEHVYDPDGTFVGIVRQRRELVRLDADTLRITQHNEPDRALQQHPMADFAGEHVFDIRIEGSLRRYLGPAVIGTGRTCGEGALVGLGEWPTFGAAFTSFSVDLGTRQLTGGTFTRGGRVVACIVGAAVPASEDWPVLSGPTDPGAVAAQWTGTRHRCTVATGAVETHDATWPLEPHGNPVLEHRSGWRIDHEGALDPPTLFRRTTALDPTVPVLVAVQRTFVDHALAHVDVWRLWPAGPPGEA